MFGEILQKFAEKSPVTVMVYGLLEHLLIPQKIDAWFESVSEVQYTRKILFSSIVGVMLQVVCGIRESVHLAYLNSEIDASRVALYDKLKNVETNTSGELLRYIAQESGNIIKEGSYRVLRRSCRLQQEFRQRP